MTYYRDEAPLTWWTKYPHGFGGRIALRAFGWLDGDHGFDRAVPDESFLDCLWEYSKIACHETRGINPCAFCKVHERATSHDAEHRGERLVLGFAETWVFSRQGIAYVAPSLVFHYVKAHHYRVPDAVSRAAMEEPRPPNELYTEMLTAVGVDWRRLSLLPPRVEAT